MRDFYFFPQWHVPIYYIYIWLLYDLLQTGETVNRIHTYIYVCIKLYNLTQLFVLDYSIIYIYIYILLIIDHNGNVSPEKRRICHQNNFFSPNGNFKTQNIFIIIFGICTYCQLLTWSDNKVRELATLCLPWQHWTKALVWFDDVDISAFHSCVFVDLWPYLSEWHLLLSAYVLVCRRENVGAWIRAANEH